VNYCKTGLRLGSEQITSYTELYSFDHRSHKEFEDGSQKHEVSTSAWKKEMSSQSTNSPDEDSHMASCSTVSLLQEELESKLSLNGIDWGNCLYCD